jgi:hypothetical protein
VWFAKTPLALLLRRRTWPAKLFQQCSSFFLGFPQEQKDGMLYRLREAIAKQAPDVIARAIAEVGAEILTVGGG